MKKPAFLKQLMMLRVLYALVPVTLAAIYLFGWRILALVAVSCLAAFVVEWIMVPAKPGKISQAVFVTGALLGLSLPPTTPYWIAAVGAAFGILFGKMVFGGFGKNIFNPAVVGRAFIFVCFPVEMTGGFVPAFRGLPGGFAQWSWETVKQLPDDLVAKGLQVADGLTAATPMWGWRDYQLETSLWDLFCGQIGGAFEYLGHFRLLAAGSAGEVSALAILLGAIYLLWTKTANWRLMAGSLIGAVAMNVLLRNVLHITSVPPLLFSLLSGAFLFATVFMVTDPISAPRIPLAMWIYAIFIGAMIIFIRWKAVFAGGVGFAILLGNMIAPSLDLWIKRYRDSKKAAAPATPATVKGPAA
ncbi:MAG TPA: RnfABCDGE type electron transport complex subunit D [Kiritimatiellia bacterium]|jgi:Na+-transporting NADH:ubiquinone oxidoreductase subunit B|nr:RnfABCDGE type electron transport complex subunit D [Kiritimatiellia bacterium]OQC58610.1 MAG: Na(+)-translocating NADH-quinone reductase subunit B [Verrucomicrobia bacterium ADurb.Bin018]MBP9572162.1 RnfABCDGE type electron transport complex subunit D [Kiritimatiellia bacterium]HOD99951.1 RnfABCDGE type electron transport complex subunit D [Kiritimatiellia bacterium]HOE36553.1 RnfABCDGE type electron transport complex subunit D [Kiritimatiellia bacterium]